MYTTWIIQRHIRRKRRRCFASLSAAKSKAGAAACCHVFHLSQDLFDFAASILAFSFSAPKSLYLCCTLYVYQWPSLYKRHARMRKQNNQEIPAPKKKEDYTVCSCEKQGNCQRSMHYIRHVYLPTYNLLCVCLCVCKAYYKRKLLKFAVPAMLLIWELM